MLRWIFHTLALFSYLNLLCFEVKFCVDSFDVAPIHSNESLIELVLENVLDVDHSELPESLPEIIFDDYRILALSIALLPVILFFAWLIRRALTVLNHRSHPLYLSKTICLPGYYTFLYRYRPF